MFRRILWLGGATLLPLSVLVFLLLLAQVHQFQLPSAPFSDSVVIDAVYFDGYELGDTDEAVCLRNVGDSSVDLGGWSIYDGESSSAVIPEGVMLQPGTDFWISREPDAFYRQFGFAADLSISPWPLLANDGDEIILSDSQQQVIDVVVFGNGNVDLEGWTGAAIQPYKAGGLFGAEGQILYRKREQGTGLPIQDTNRVYDWAQSADESINGKRIRYPGWDFDEFQFPVEVKETAALTVAVAPDNALETVVSFINGARSRVAVESLTIENIKIGEALAAAAARGVSVKLLLEGDPVGGIADQEKHICRLIEEAGGECWFMIRDDGQRINDRYRYLHAKFILVDQHQVAVSSENLSPNSMPADDKRDGTWGRRGVILFTDAPTIVNHVQTIFDRDLDPQNHVDLFRWQASDSKYGAPSPGFTPITESGGITYTVRYPEPSVFHGQVAFELQQSPENSLRDQDGLLGLISQAGKGDTIKVQQLQERPHWGPSNSSYADDPNPRLEAYIQAARRGAEVQLLLDQYFNNPNSSVSNLAACKRVNETAVEENLDLSCKLGNPTGLGIHNKMVLADIGGQGFVHVGSLNGTELSSKGNRELALLVQSTEAYHLLSDMFDRDKPQLVYLPITAADSHVPPDHLLISEVLYDPFGPDDTEFIELVNPTQSTLDIGGWAISDASNPADYEDQRLFPLGTRLQPNQVLLISTSGLAFYMEYGQWPDFEILDTTEHVPNLIDDPAWGDPGTFLRLGNLGDEVIFRNSRDQIVDAIVFGDGELMGNEGCPLLQAPNHSFERYPFWRDSDNCPDDFRDWPFPSPGKLP